MNPWKAWPNVPGMSVVFIEEEDCDAFAKAADAIDKALEPKPEIPCEVWNDRPIDPDVCMQAVRAMCG
jgi:hypothetical protein